MDKVDPLAQLKDIHLPESIGWWPLAAGWYVAIGLFCVFVASLCYWFYKKRRDAQAKNQALRLLLQYTERYERERNAAMTCAQVSELLKRVALAYFPRHDIASLHGEAWIHFLNQSARGVDFAAVKTLLLETPFKNTDSVDVTPLLKNAESWIRQRKTPCLS